MSKSNLAEQHSAASPEIPTIPGTPFGGGFYAGRIAIDGKAYALVVAPKADGERSGLAWQPNWRRPTPGTQSLNDGLANSEAMNDAKHPAAQWTRSLSIAGFTDWYLPSRDELEMLYRAFKPGTDENYVYSSRADWWGADPGAYNGLDKAGNGSNTSSYPAGAPYTADLPAQTTVDAFRADGPEAFAERYYWSSTEFGSGHAWLQGFVAGGQDCGVEALGGGIRAVRKVLI